MRLRTWTTAQIRTLRRLYGKVPVRDLAARLGKTESALKTKAKKLGVQNRNRFLTDEERDAIRRDYGKVPTAELAQRLGRKISCVQRLAGKMGLSRPTPRVTQGERERIRALNALGWSDAEIGGELGHDRHCIGLWRRRMGLKEHYGTVGTSWHERGRERVRQKTAAQLAAAGLASLGELRKESYRDFARRNGWPDDLRPRAVMILNLLATRGVPLSRMEIADGIGLPWRGSRQSLKSIDPEGSYLAHLVKRGLVLRLPRAGQVLGRGKGHSHDLYTLGPGALCILRERADREGQSCGT